MRVIGDLAELHRLCGTELGTSDWLEIAQDRIDAFADATGDHQWIHVDPERAAAGPFKETIAHGYLTVALIPFLSAQVYSLETLGAARLNYGVNKVRFPAPVPVGSRIRDRVHLHSATSVAAGIHVTFRHSIEIEGRDRPACVAENVVLVVP
jgi:acyl dehydratase